MLIEFSVSNFRSFREKQTFSMVAAPRLRKGENVFKLVVKGEKLPDLLKVAAIYGPNASGKSNLIKAFAVVPTMASRQPSVQQSILPVAPFRFDPLLIDKPSCFELHFVHAGQRYAFELALTTERIVLERLMAFPEGKESLLYERLHTTLGDEYNFGSQLEGGKDLHQLWKNVTSKQVLFLSQAVANSNENLNQLRVPLQWLQYGVMAVSGDMANLWAKSSLMFAKDNLSVAGDISSFLQTLDVPVTNIRVDQIDTRFDELTKLVSDRSRFAEFTEAVVEAEIKTVLTHRTAMGEAEFDLLEESDGTQNLIGFWLQWRTHQLSNDELRIILAVDELDSSLHPDIVAALVAKLLKADTPTQLVFTTHDTHLMDTKLLRRDQFWLTERDVNGATQMRSIHDFQGRESEDIEKRYYEGRYRGLPLLRKS